MLNHFRCLLMNAAPAAPADHYLAEELVDPAYVPVALPTALAQVRRVLFGTAPDRHMLNIQCARLLALVHATPLAEYVFALDPRVTYSFAGLGLVDPAAWAPAVTRAAGAGTLTVLGEPDPPDATGAVGHDYLVTVDTPGSAAVERRTRPTQKTFFGFAPNARLPLPGSGCDFRLSSDAAGQAFSVALRSRPARDLAAACDALAGLGEPVHNYLFGVTRVEPYLTFRGLFFRKRELPLRLSALVCAAVYRAEEVRRANT